MDKKQSHSPVLRIKFKSSTWYYIYVCMIWSEGILSDYVRAVFMRLPVLNHNNGHTAITMLYILMMLMAIPYLMQYWRGVKVIIPMLIAASYLGTYLLFPQNTEYLDRYFGTFFFTVLPMIYLGMAWEVEPLMRKLYWVSVVNLVCAMIYHVLIGDRMSSTQSQYSGSMEQAYRILPHLCLVSYYAIRRMNLMNIVLTALGAVFLLFLGTRGAVLCFLIFLVLVVFLLARTRNKVLMVCGVTAVFLYLMDGSRFLLLAMALERITERLGLSVRIVAMVQQGTLFQLTGRDVIQSRLWAALDGHDFWGYGYFGDRILVGQYAHNLLLELMVDFGTVLGGLLIVLLTVLLVRRFLKCQSGDEKAFLLLLICCSVMCLMLSGSYLTEPQLFLLIGICMVRQRKSIVPRGGEGNS